MSQLLVRGIEPEVVERLKASAKENGRSLEAEVRHILRQAAHSPKQTLEETRETIKRIRSMFKDRQFSDSTELIREDRER